MKRCARWVIGLALSAGALLAQNVTGTWQGTLQIPQVGRDLRLVIKISRADDESLRAVVYSIDQGGQPINASSITQQGSTIKMGIAAIGGEYEGKLNGDAINGTWSQGGPTTPLNLARATPQTTWAIPEPPPPPKLMPSDANPEFEVATIKPTKPGTGFSILVGRGGANLLTTTNTSVSELLIFAYGLHARQISGGPAWLETEKYDISAKPDTEGMPNDRQIKSMMQRLLADRFHLVFYREKKELSVYAITLTKTGPKLNKSESKQPLPGFGFRGPGNMIIQNATMAELASVFQAQVLERPVVDQTSIEGRYNFTLKWTPDPSQFGGRGANVPPPADGAEAPPDLFTAIQQQIGLKLESTKAPVEVLVIDKVEKPSEN
jgi:uncharacterized protein (TIGR03435 family)